MTHANLTWPDLSTLIADLVARVGSPLRLAIRLLSRSESRDIKQQIRNLENAVRARLAPLIAEIAAFPPVAELCAKTLAARLARQDSPRAEQTPRTPATPAAAPSARMLSDAPPAFRYIVASPSQATHAVSCLPHVQSTWGGGPGATAREAERARQKPARRQPRPHCLSPDATHPSSLPLARRLAALVHVIANPEDAAFDILRRNPNLVATASPAPTRLPAPAPVNRHERRSQKKKLKLALRPKASRLARRSQRNAAHLTSKTQTTRTPHDTS